MAVRTPTRERATARRPRRLSAAQRIYNYLVGVLGLSPGAAAGVLGNFKVESGFSPRAYNAGENAHGLAQWEGSRWPALQQYAARRRLDPLTLPAQLGFLRMELTHGYSSTLDELRSTSDPTTAAHYFQRDFEGSSTASLPDRERYARQIYAQIRAGRPLTGGPLGTHTAGGSPLGRGAGGSGAAGFDNPLNPLANGLSDFVRWFEKWALSFLLVIVGLAAIIIAFVIVTKGVEHSDDDKHADDGPGLVDQVEDDAGEHHDEPAREPAPA